MARARYIMQRTGGPLVRWDGMRPPSQTRASDTTALGSLGSTDVFDQPRRLPRGGAPEYLNDGFGGFEALGCMGPQPANLPPGVMVRAMGGCGCQHGKKAMGDVAPAPQSAYQKILALLGGPTTNGMTCRPQDPAQPATSPYNQVSTDDCTHANATYTAQMATATTRLKVIGAAAVVGALWLMKK